MQYVLLVSVVLPAGSFAAFHPHGGTVEEARTVAVNVFVAAQVAYLLDCRSLRDLCPRVGFRRR